MYLYILLLHTALIKLIINTSRSHKLTYRLRLNPNILLIDGVRQPTHPLHPVKMNNACTPCITAAAGTRLAGASCFDQLNLVFDDSVLQMTIRRLNAWTFTGSSWRSLPKILHCCPRVGARALSQSRCGRPVSQIGYGSSASRTPLPSPRPLIRQLPMN